MMYGKVPDRQEAGIGLEVVGRNQKAHLSLLCGNRVELGYGEPFEVPGQET